MEEEKQNEGAEAPAAAAAADATATASAKEEKEDTVVATRPLSPSSLKSNVATADNLTSWVSRTYDKASAIPEDIRHRIHSLDELLYFLKARRNDLRNGSLGDKIRELGAAGGGQRAEGAPNRKRVAADADVLLLLPPPNKLSLPRVLHLVINTHDHVDNCYLLAQLALPLPPPPPPPRALPGRLIDVPEVRESVEYCREPLQHCRELMDSILEMSNSTFTSISFYTRPKKFRKVKSCISERAS